MKDLNIVKHKPGKTSKGIKRLRSVPPHARAKYPASLDSLHSVIPHAAIFTAFSKYAITDEETDSADECKGGSDLPESLYALYDKHWEGLHDDDKTKRIDFLLKRGIGDHEICQVELHTRLQSNCIEWFEQRCGRITASVISKVLKCKSTASAARLAENITQSPLIQYQSRQRKPQAVRYGTEHESLARQQYASYQVQNHQAFECRDAGLCISAKWQYIAASPDGFIKCSCCGRGVIEIKCPYKYRDAKINEIKDETFYRDENLNLKENHEYMFQVQAEMACANVEYCDFVCWTKECFVIVRIRRDKDFFEKHMPALHAFCRDAVLPQLLSRKSSLKQ